MPKPIVHVVHCVDTEGPLEETLEATFERLYREKKIYFEPSIATLQALQKKEIDLGEEVTAVAEFLSPERLAYLSSWREIEEMVLHITDENFRREHSSPDGSLYTFSWFIVDVVGYKDNPRRKATGFHTIWDKYQRILKKRFFNDTFGWHFHTVPPTYDALHYNTSWTSNDFHEQVLARRIIERQWFPSLFRAGGVVERNDLSYWLERFIPFDYSNQNNKYATFKPGDQSDWRGAPTKWMPYHPSFYDYRKRGDMKRSIFRCLDIKNVGCILDEAEVREAFQEAQASGHAILAYTNHDRRDIRSEITHMHNLIEATAKAFPEVQWRYSNALVAARSALNISCKRPLEIQLSFENNALKIRSNQPLFTGDLFLAVEERGGIFYRDNTTIESDTEWAYSSPRWENITSVGVGAVTSDGQSACASLKLGGA